MPASNQCPSHLTVAYSETATSNLLTKTAQRKAAKAARLEKQRQKALAKGKLGDAAHPSDADSSRPETPLPTLNDLPPTDEEVTYAPAPVPTGQSPLAASVLSGDTARSNLSVPPSAPKASAPEPSPPPPAVVPSPPKPSSANAVPELTTPVPTPQIPPALQKAKEVVTNVVPAKAQEAVNSVVPTVNQVAAKLATPEDPVKAKKRQDIIERTLWTFIMIGGFISELIPHLSYRHALIANQRFS